MHLSRKSVISHAISDGVLNKRTHRICKILNETNHQITVAPATAFIDFLKGMEFTHSVYRRAGIVQKRHLFLFNEGLLHPNSTLFLARKDQHIIGTISVIANHQNRMPCTKLFGEEIAALRLEKRKAVELGTLSVKPGAERDNLVFRLYLNVMIYTIFVEKVDDIFIQVRDKVASFYERNFLFKQVGQSKKQPDYSNIDSTLLRVDVKKLREKIYEQQCYGAMGWQRILCELGLLQHYRAVCQQCHGCQRYVPDQQEAEVYRYLCTL